jgi:transcriptional regulator with XRE-family HTH domain
MKREHKEERVISAEEKIIRRRIIGVLLRTARLRAQKSVDECAAALSCDPAFIVRAEEGRGDLTLPQVESLADVLDVPLNCLLGEQEMPSEPPLPEPIYLQSRMNLRRKIIGVLLRQARLDGGYSLEEMAAELDCEPDDLARIELGQEPIALADLQVLARMLGISIDEFVAEGRAPQPVQELGAPPADLNHLSPELREFVQQPMNAAYVQIALNLSQMPAEALRQFASGLLEITY